MNLMADLRGRIVRRVVATRRAFLQSQARTAGPGSDLGRRSSITDDAAYLDVCARATEDPRIFRTFRREPTYVATLEHVSEEQGAEYLRLIERNSPHLLGERLEVFRANDQWGSPITFDYPHIGRISPVTLRYLKVLGDLERHFGDLTDKRIIEIGVGYGGQARLVLENWPVRSYTLVDLEPVLGLTRRYLGKFGLQESVIFQPPESLIAARYDLCISNFAFSELSRGVQDSYARSVVAAASQGYLTCNFISSAYGIESWSKDELSQMNPGAHWLPEEPLTYEGNAILVWGDIGGPSPRAGHESPDET